MGPNRGTIFKRYTSYFYDPFLATPPPLIDVPYGSLH